MSRLKWLLLAAVVIVYVLFPLAKMVQRAIESIGLS